MSEPHTSSLDTLLTDLLKESRKQTALMQQIADNQLMLIDAMAEEPADIDVQPLTYMDGRPVL